MADGSSLSARLTCVSCRRQVDLAITPRAAVGTWGSRYEYRDGAVSRVGDVCPDCQPGIYA